MENAVRTKETEVERGMGARSHALSIVAPSAHFRLLQANPRSASRQSDWALQYQSPRRVPREDVMPVSDGFRFSGRLSLAMGEFVEILIATSGTLVVVIILLAMAMMMRAIRALLRR
jgi:hypothetical protein